MDISQTYKNIHNKECKYHWIKDSHIVFKFKGDKVSKMEEESIFQLNDLLNNLHTLLICLIYIFND